MGWIRRGGALCGLVGILWPGLPAAGHEARSPAYAVDVRVRLSLVPGEQGVAIRRYDWSVAEEPPGGLEPWERSKLDTTIREAREHLEREFPDTLRRALARAAVELDVGVPLNDLAREDHRQAQALVIADHMAAAFYEAWEQEQRAAQHAAETAGPATPDVASGPEGAAVAPGEPARVTCDDIPNYGTCFTSDYEAGWAHWDVACNTCAIAHYECAKRHGTTGGDRSDDFRRKHGCYKAGVSGVVPPAGETRPPYGNPIRARP